MGTLDYRLHYPRYPGAAHFVGYSDSDHDGNINTCKSTSGSVFFLAKCLINWQSVKQQVVAMSNCEAEYIAATQVFWLARLLGDLLGKDDKAVESNLIFWGSMFRISSSSQCFQVVQSDLVATRPTRTINRD